MFTFVKEIRPLLSASSCSRIGATARQGPHQGAQKSTTTGPSTSRTSLPKLSCVTSRTAGIVAAAAVALAAPGVARADTNADRARAAEAQLGATVGHRTLRAWPSSQVAAAAIAVGALPDATRAERLSAAARIRQLERYRDARGYRAERGGDVYVDDNEWIALDQLDWRDATGDRAMLARATRTFGLVVHEWDGGRRRRCPGGVYWTEATANRD